MPLLNFNPQSLGLLGDSLTGIGMGLLNQQPNSSGQYSTLGGVGQGLQYAQGLQQQRRQTTSDQLRDKIAQEQLALQQQTAAQQQTAFQQQQQQIAAQKAAAQGMFGGPAAPANQSGFRQSGAGPGASVAPTAQPGNPAITAGMSPDQIAFMQQLATADPSAALNLGAQQILPKPMDPSTNMKDYSFYASQARSMGQEPLPFNDWSLQQKRATANMTTLNMPPQENEFQKHYGGAGGDAAGKMMYETIPAAQSRLTQLDALKSTVAALEAAGGETGNLAPYKAKATALMQAFGMDPKSLGLPADAGPYQAISAITNKLALDARSTADGAGMPGAMSEGDRIFLSEIAPNIGNTPVGLKMKVEISEKVAKRQTEAASKWAKYPQTQAGWSQFQQDWIKYNQDHPIFGPDDMKKIAGLQPAASPQAPIGAPAVPHPALPSGGDWQ